ncbi:MAG TPA: hypothetical protein VFS25_06775 [Chitinophaga sp.]|uniref:hypothetical protein n=1 Tax=Chitinophaga sp. TaxID=1869181 RepID=UPI002DBCA63D|nr:hypothetical protein [Chitinophaga sp.]HEU4552516.1 hypothetical protein [Chitinophaga sp.]
MANKLSFPHHYYHMHIQIAVVTRFIEWIAALVTLITAFPLLIRLWMYLLTQLYEVFIQYQYLF